MYAFSRCFHSKRLTDKKGTKAVPGVVPFQKYTFVTFFFLSLKYAYWYLKLNLKPWYLNGTYLFHFEKIPPQ